MLISIPKQIMLTLLTYCCLHVLSEFLNEEQNDIESLNLIHRLPTASVHKVSISYTRQMH